MKHKHSQVRSNSNFKDFYELFTALNTVKKPLKKILLVLPINKQFYSMQFIFRYYYTHTNNN